jgi:hypothetical protein
MINNEVKCSFNPIPKRKRGKDQETKKAGRYFRSIIRVKGLQDSKWAILANLDIPEFNSLLEEGHTKEDIVKAGLKYLNEEQIPKTKDGTPKKGGKLPYGKIQFYKMVPNDQDKIQCLLTTNNRSSSHFWGEGVKL